MDICAAVATTTTTFACSNSTTATGYTYNVIYTVLNLDTHIKRKGALPLITYSFTHNDGVQLHT